MSFFVEACLGEKVDQKTLGKYTEPQKFGWKFSSTVNQNKLYEHLGSLTPLHFRGQSSSFLCRCTLHLDGFGLKKAVLKIFSGSKEELAREWSVYKCTVSSFEDAPYFAYPFFCFEYSLTEYNTLKENIEQHVPLKPAQEKYEGEYEYEEVDDGDISNFLPSHNDDNERVMIVCTEDCGSLFLGEGLEEEDQVKHAEVACSYFVQVTEALTVMQTNGLAHLDLHHYNILFTDGKIKIFDWDKAEEYGKVDSIEKVVLSLYGVLYTLHQIGANAVEFEYIADDVMVLKLQDICSGLDVKYKKPDVNLKSYLHKIICEESLGSIIGKIKECWKEMFNKAYTFIFKSEPDSDALNFLFTNLGNAVTIFDYYCRETTELDLSEVQANSMFRTTYDFNNLQKLYLDDNLITTLDSDGELSSLTNLTTLSVVGNELESLPESLSNLTKLTSLDVSDNDFGVFPEVVCSLTQLTSLGVKGNELESLPESLSNLTKLTSLDVSDNVFGVFPEVVCSLTQLTSLSVSGTGLRFLPKSLSNLRSLTSLDVSDNVFDVFPEVVCSLTQLTSLSVGGNELESLPESLSNLTKLTSLDVSNNRIESIPVNLAILRQLEWLDVSGNNFEDTAETKTEFTTLIQLLNKRQPNLEIVTHQVMPLLTKSR